MSAAELETYIADLEVRMANETSGAELLYRRASLFCSLSMHTESLPLFEEAMEDMRQRRNESEMASLFLYTGAAYASALDFLGQIDKAMAIYQELLAVSPEASYIGDYAVFLHRRKKDYNQAQKYYVLAIKTYPDHSSILLKYAGFLRHIKKDLVGAESYYGKACAANESHADAFGSYASFLHNNPEKADVVEKLYEKAVALDPLHANNHCNFGLFLSEEKNNFEVAEKMYQKALYIAPKHCNSLYNYAVMLDTHCQRKVEAETLYRQAIDVDKRHAFALYNLAVLLEEIALDREMPYQEEETGADRPFPSSRHEISDLYRRAMEADQRDATAMADYGRFEFLKMNKLSIAKELLTRALSLDNSNEVALYNLALLIHRQLQENETSNSSARIQQLQFAEKLLRALTDKNRKHLAGLQELARILVDLNTDPDYTPSKVVVTKSTSSDPVVDGNKVATAWMEEVIELYEVILAKHKEPRSILQEYINVSNKHGSARQKMRAIATVQLYSNGNVTGLDGDGAAIAKALESVAGSS